MRTGFEGMTSEGGESEIAWRVLWFNVIVNQLKEASIVVIRHLYTYMNSRAHVTGVDPCDSLQENTIQRG